MHPNSANFETLPGTSGISSLSSLNFFYVCTGLHKCAISLHYPSSTESYILGVFQQNVCQMHTCILVCIISASCLHKSALGMHTVCIFTNPGSSPEKTRVSLPVQTLCRKHAYSAHFKQTLCILCAYLFLKVCIWRTLHTWPKCASQQKSGMRTLHTCSLVCKVCTIFQPLSGNVFSLHPASPQGSDQTAKPRPLPPARYIWFTTLL
jgi:hypothetical protein